MCLACDLLVTSRGWTPHVLGLLNGFIAWEVSFSVEVECMGHSDLV